MRTSGEAPSASATEIASELKKKLKKGMRIISELEQARDDGLVFKFEGDLMYELVGEQATARAPPGLCVTRCQRSSCKQTEQSGGYKFCCCSKCGSKYCSRDCQVKDWKAVHKAMCSQLRDLRERASSPVNRQAVVARVLVRIRLYLCPFAVCHGDAHGRGFVFVQSPNPVLELSYLKPVNSNGLTLDRSVLLQFLTLGEFVDAVMQEDFELGVIRGPLESAVGCYDPDVEAVVLFRGRCGYMAVLTVPLVPDVFVCRQLGAEYEDKDALQLHLDDSS
ncbi:unnamed protein product [Discosporangium mesarthrocarpum]